jgi:hypothetical protein
MNSLFLQIIPSRMDLVCYHKDLEPFMARGRVLREEKIETRGLCYP